MRRFFSSQRRRVHERSYSYRRGGDDHDGHVDRPKVILSPSHPPPARTRRRSRIRQGAHRVRREGRGRGCDGRDRVDGITARDYERVVPSQHGRVPERMSRLVRRAKIEVVSRAPRGNGGHHQEWRVRCKRANVRVRGGSDRETNYKDEEDRGGGDRVRSKMSGPRED